MRFSRASSKSGHYVPQTPVRSENEFLHGFAPVGKTEYLVYHAWDPEMKVRQLCIDKLEWTARGPRCKPTCTPQPMP